ncbi:MAG: hypothetical protein KAY22_05610 [Rhizorhabdus sp.]|uniref:hypothetical protein n=1 Tax=Rhizorhabdus sp. TaxID=1968843 RepID=UPI001B455A6D|nr:hypothetical protein [Rhizorhabdus sp.]MBP8231762.1 hypothetical protein [Rhizorhabdus sp.]
MSLEEALARNTAALEALTATLKAGGAKADKTAKPAAAPAAAPAPAATATAATEAPTEAPKPASTATPKQVADALVEVVTKLSRERGVALLAQFGVQQAAKLKPEQMADFVAACKAALTQGAAPAAAGSDLL